MKHFQVGPKGATLGFVDGVTGEVRSEIHLREGVYPLSRFAPFRRAGEVLVLPGVLLGSVGNTESIQCDGHWESAANPSFHISASQRQVRDIMLMMRRTQALAKRTAEQLKASQRAKAAVPQIAPPEVAVPLEDGGAGEVPAT